MEGTPINFEVDTGAVFSAIQQPLGPLSSRKSLVQGANGSRERPWTTQRTVNLGKGTVQHSFLVLPDCPAPLLGRDLLTKLGAQITFTAQGPELKFAHPMVGDLRLLTLELPATEEYRLYGVTTPATQLTMVPTGLGNEEWTRKFPEAWAETGGPGLAVEQPPVVVTLKPTAVPARVRQYPLSREAREGIKPHIERFLELGILRPCQSDWNTPLLPVRKPGTNDYRPVQDLREVNTRVMDIHPTVPNPYNLLSMLPPERKWYTVLDLKDAFFCLPLHPDSQKLFAFEWSDPEKGRTGQLTWTRLPQGFKNSPTIFDEALHRDLREFRETTPEVTLLQYVDDLLLATDNRDACRRGTEKLLGTLARLGYRASAKKAQICQNRVIFLGYSLEGGKRWLTDARKKTVSNIPAPSDRRQLREFLGAAGFCRLWIPGFAAITEPFSPLLKEKNPFFWQKEHQTAFETLKKALLSAPALALPDVSKPFTLYLHEKKGVAVGVLAQTLGPWKRPVAYLSKRLDPVARGWPTCLRAVAAAATLVRDADKLTLGQHLTIIAPHALESIVRQPPERWLSNARATYYQTTLLDRDRITFGPPSLLNPATLLPVPPEEGENEPVHNCEAILAEETGVRKDLTDQPLAHSDLIWYTDGSSFLNEGQRKAGAAVVDKNRVIWSSSLPEGTSAQKAELIALTQALTMAAGKRATIYTDSRYAFATAHVHGAIYRERGLLTSAGKEIKNKKEIEALLEAVMLPRELAIVHCPGHQKGNSPVAVGNRKADQEAKEAALRDLKSLAIHASAPEDPAPEETPLPEPLRDTLERIHKLTHLGSRKLIQLISEDKTHSPSEKKHIAEEVVVACRACQQVNAYPGKLAPGKRLRGTRPGQHWEVDFTEVKPAKYGLKYLLVFLDTFSGWVEAFPTKRETAIVVAKKILEDIFPRFGLPQVIGSDNGPAFVAQVSQGLAKVLGINWKLHCAYRPQSSGQVERMNRSIKETLTKLTIETGSRDWTMLLPYALFRARNTPSFMGLTPFEILFGCAPPVRNLTLRQGEIMPSPLSDRLQTLASVQHTLWKQLSAAYQPSGDGAAHQFHVGDYVYVRRHQHQTLEPRWKGPYQVLLTTPTAVKVDGIAAWIHASHLKPAKVPDDSWAMERTDNPLKLRIRRQCDRK